MVSATCVGTDRPINIARANKCTNTTVYQKIVFVGTLRKRGRSDRRFHIIFWKSLKIYVLNIYPLIYLMYVLSVLFLFRCVQ